VSGINFQACSFNHSDISPHLESTTCERQAETEAQLPKLDGALWHAYRRKWATERKHLPLKDVAAAGGWVDVETLLRSYQQPDKGTLLAVMNEPRKLSEIVSAGP
jgi:hypothetical protein